MILDGNDITAVYYYDVSGSRISKSTEAGDTFFTYAGDILAAQKTGNNILVWIYDNNGKYIGFSYNGTEYYYIYNLQGDVEAIADSTGTIVAKYAYDPWGKPISITDGNGTDVSSNATHIANINPIRYRGYYYDTETGFYYLNSRYYDPEVGRFINADRQLNSDILGNNLFVYCGNNPVMFCDPTGEIAITTLILIGSVVAGVLAAGHTAAKSYKNTGKVDVQNTIINGISAFMFCYSFGMSSYGFYIGYCDYKGYTPVTNVGGSSNTGASNISGYSGAGKSNTGSSGISSSDALRIQNAANRTQQNITVVGSRASGTAGPNSDWDYIMSGNSAQRHSAASSVPRGVCGGENNMGIDIFSSYANGPNPVSIDRSKPYVEFFPE